MVSRRSTSGVRTRTVGGSLSRRRSADGRELLIAAGQIAPVLKGFALDLTGTGDPRFMAALGVK